jgi:predicted ATP-grasp superfamily ATP-dependent carboligase
MSSDPSLLRGLEVRDPTYAGPTGIVGVLHQTAMDRGFQAVSLWAPASHYAAGVTNAKASLGLVRALEAVTGLDVGSAALQEAAAAFERQVTRAVDSDPRLRRLVDELEEAADTDPGFSPRSLPSGDDLAAELERYLREREGEDRPD